MADLTPKQIARAMDVSESTIKRWCDKGIIPTQYTSGGHRRVAMASLLHYLREKGQPLLHPEVLGLPSSSGRTNRVLQRAREQMVQALEAGQEMLCRHITFDLYMAEHPLSVICDELLGAAFRQIGDRWACGETEVYQERRACEITLHILYELRSLLPPIKETAPAAMGGAASGDQYSLGTAMAELVLRDSGWNATSLGDNLPFATMAAAIRRHRPKLFWLSCSHLQEPREFIDGYGALHQEFGHEVAFIVGGYAMTDGVRQQIQYASHGDKMQHLEEFAQLLRGTMQERIASNQPSRPTAS